MYIYFIFVYLEKKRYRPVAFGSLEPIIRRALCIYFVGVFQSLWLVFKRNNWNWCFNAHLQLHLSPAHTFAISVLTLTMHSMVHRWKTGYVNLVVCVCSRKKLRYGGTDSTIKNRKWKPTFDNQLVRGPKLIRTGKNKIICHFGNGRSWCWNSPKKRLWKSHQLNGLSQTEPVQLCGIVNTCK